MPTRKDTTATTSGAVTSCAAWLCVPSSHRWNGRGRTLAHRPSTVPFHALQRAANHAATAKGTIVLVSVWIWTPFVVTCVLAGLQTIPVQLYEAARVDGAGAWKQFWHITLPGLRSVLIVVILLRGIWMFNKFDVIWLLTKGGPLNETETLPTLAYRKAFLEFDLGGGAAVATISFLMLASIILIYLRVFPIDEAKQGR